MFSHGFWPFLPFHWSVVDPKLLQDFLERGDIEKNALTLNLVVALDAARSASGYPILAAGWESKAFYLCHRGLATPSQGNPRYLHRLELTLKEAGQARRRQWVHLACVVPFAHPKSHQQCRYQLRQAYLSLKANPQPREFGQATHERARE